jgi:flagellar motility protein MotE (MotC chaperone)
VEPRLGSPGDPLADVAAELARRAAELEGRERELALREAAAAAVETRLGEQLARLEGLKKELEGLARRIAGQDEAEIAQLVKTYEAMKARSAAQVFDQLALDLLLPIVRRMREAKLAAILAAMEPARAKQVTAALAQQTPLPRLP